jgi:hypothetical protein
VFDNLQDGIWAVLGEAVLLAEASNFPFAVIGGWSPFLLNSNPIKHPGTRDVDLLFSRGKEIGALRDVFKAFVAAGYVPSAKHPFQLLRVLEVGHQKIAFNVDFLHPDEKDKSADMFVDHHELDLWVDEQRLGKLLVKSVVTPVSQFIFDGHVELLRREIRLPNSAHPIVVLPVMDELGTVVTKSESVKSPKRQRDALDIYLAIAQARDRSKLASDARALAKSHPMAFHALHKLRVQVDGQDTQFWRSMEWCQAQWGITSLSSDKVKNSILSFFDAVGVTGTGVDSQKP